MITARNIISMVESLRRPKLMKESAELVPFTGLDSLEATKQKIAKIKPAALKSAVNVFLKEIQKLKFRKGELEADKSFNGWGISLDCDESDRSYSLAVYFPVNTSSLSPDTDLMELKWHTRDDVLRNICGDCDLDTFDDSILTGEEVVFCAGFYFALGE